MRLAWWTVWCVVWVCVCRALPTTEHPNTQAQECELYGTQDAAPPIMQFQRRISIGIIPRGSTIAGQLNLFSAATGTQCQLFFVPGSITPICGNDQNPQKLEESDATELWMDVVPRAKDSHTAWDLRVVGRQGRRRTHILVADSGLQPPVLLWFMQDNSMEYYFNCVTGCLFEKSIVTAAGDHTFFLRHDEGFTHMSVDCGVMAADFSPPVVLGVGGNFTKKLFINVTAAELGPPGGLKEVKVVWNKVLGNIGILVNGAPVGNFTGYGTLMKERQVKVEVAGGGGLVAPCDPHFQTVACDGDEQEKAAAATSEPSTTSSSATNDAPTHESILGPTKYGEDPQPHQQSCDGWLPAAFTLQVLIFILVAAAVSVQVWFFCRYCRSSDVCHFAKDSTAAPITFSKKSSTRSSTRSVGQRGSQRRKNQHEATKDKAPESGTEASRARSETVTTPLTTPDSLASPRTHKNLSTDELVDINLM